ncbi:hypothetical protein ACLMJK_005863 [Lecanora helva]
MAESVPVSTHTVAVSLPDLPITPRGAQSPRKRRRSSKQSPRPAPISKACKGASSQEYTPKTLTGAAAIFDEKQAKREQELLEARHTSPNPAHRALGDLLGQQSGMSKLQDAPSQADLSSEPVVERTSSVEAPEAIKAKPAGTPSPAEGALETITQGADGFGTLEATPAVTLNANGTAVASPAQMEDVIGEDDITRGRDEQSGLVEDDGRGDPEEGRSNKAFTYPGPMLSAQAHRTSSLPQPGYGGGRDSTRSPSTKRHKCPYCSTDFTRHHNLKSHLLTHSHEKPYSCDTCEARFRRLHDLKRHTKLHTGERPHVCPRCDRSFARGDALARHTKGQGGCAGRRSSMGSFGGDDKQEGSARAGEGDSMPGIMYTGEASHEPEHMDDDNGSPSAMSLPSIRKHEAPPVDQHRHIPEHTTVYQSRQPSTYPPVAARPPTGGLYPPPTASPRGSGTSTTQTSLNQASQPPPSGASQSFQTSGPNVFAQGGMTESPKPLSPAGMTSHQLGHAESAIHRNRSPSLSQQFQHQQYGRRVTGSNTSPPMNLLPPHANVGHPNAPQLPSLPGLNPPEPRFTLQSQAPGPSHLHSTASSAVPGAHHAPSSPSYAPGNLSSANNSLSSHSTGPHTSLDRSGHSYPQPPEQLWAYVRSLEVKVDRLQEEISVIKQQLNTGSAASQQQH